MATVWTHGTTATISATLSQPTEFVFMVDDLVLRKHAARRLYDANRRRILRLGDIAELIKAGAQIAARDSIGRDITAELLSRIVLHEQIRKEGGPLSIEAMRALIRLTGSNEPSAVPTFLGSLAACLELLPTGPASSTPSPTAAGEQPE